MAFDNIKKNPFDLKVQTGLQDPPSNQTVFLKTFDKDHLSGEHFVSGGEQQVLGCMPACTLSSGQG